MGVKIVDETPDAVLDADEQEHEEQVQEQVESEQKDESAEEKVEESGEAEELTLTIGDEKPEEEEERKAPEWVRELRKSDREKTRRIRELEQALKAASPAAATPRLGPRPKLEEFDYDTEKYEAAVDSWLEKKAEVDRVEREREAAERKQQEEWQGRLDAYKKRKEALAFPDVDDAEETAKTALSELQQAIIVDATESPELVMYALGKHPSKLQQLASMQNPARFAVAIGRLEASLKVTGKKPSPPPPEKTVRPGGAAGVASLDNTLEKLREEAERTGNYSKVIAYRKQKQAK